MDRPRRHQQKTPEQIARDAIQRGDVAPEYLTIADFGAAKG